MGLTILTFVEEYLVPGEKASDYYVCSSYLPYCKSCLISHYCIKIEMQLLPYVEIKFVVFRCIN